MIDICEHFTTEALMTIATVDDGKHCFKINKLYFLHETWDNLQANEKRVAIKENDKNHKSRWIWNNKPISILCRHWVLPILHSFFVCVCSNSFLHAHALTPYALLCPSGICDAVLIVFSLLGIQISDSRQAFARCHMLLHVLLRCGNSIVQQEKNQQ